MSASAAASVKVKPRWRGIPDVIGTAIAIPASALLVEAARPGVASLAAAIYAACLVTLLATSAIYHTPMWSPANRRRMRRLDHAAIFLLIAGSYTPFCLMHPATDTGASVFRLSWAGAALGIATSLAWPSAPRFFNVALYIALGWIMVPLDTTIVASLDAQTVTLITVGGVLYSVGAVTYWRRWPNPSPAVFGYHEVYHLFVLAAAACHFVAIWRVVA